MAEQRTIIDDNCFVIPPLSGPREDAVFSGKPFISGITPAPALSRLFDVDKPRKTKDDDEMREDVKRET